MQLLIPNFQICNTTFIIFTIELPNTDTNTNIEICNFKPKILAVFKSINTVLSIVKSRVVGNKALIAEYL